MRLLGQDDWLFYARREDGVLVFAITEMNWHWLEAPHGSGCWNEVTGRNCDGETRSVCRRDCAWMHAYVRLHLGKFHWRECGHDTDGTYLGWGPERDEAFMASSRGTYLPHPSRTVPQQA